MDPITIAALITALGSLGAAGISNLGGNDDKNGQQDLKSRGQRQQVNQILQQLQQMQGPNGAYSQAQNQLQDWLDPNSGLYKNFEQPYLNEYYQKTLPETANRFVGNDPFGGGLNSSGFGQALGAAGANLQATLAAQKSGLQRQSIGDIMNQYNQLTSQGLNQNVVQNTYQPGGPGFAAEATAGATQAAGNYVSQNGFPQWMKDLFGGQSTTGTGQAAQKNYQNSSFPNAGNTAYQAANNYQPGQPSKIRLPGFSY